MQISIVIVSYNVKHFLEMCLYSVFKAVATFETEVFVVDNNSQDGSVEMVERLFPKVKLIANKSNPGFGVANNQAAHLATGKYLLFLNPDTIVSESTFVDCVSFMEQNTQCGAVGVHMINGQGQYLKESKRALPTPAVAFYKVFGLSRLFPRNKYFSKYHLGNLDDNDIHQVEILSGAFMFTRHEVMRSVGFFDEQFFMYGEDIDLSYRIILGGYSNYYLGSTPIIHFKGESTKKGSLNYVKIFYKAMEVFARKHFVRNGFSFSRLIIEFAIWLRACLAFAYRLLSYVILPIKRLLGSVFKNFLKQRVSETRIGWIGSSAIFETIKNKTNYFQVEFISEDLNFEQLNRKSFNRILLSMNSLTNQQIIELTKRLGDLGIVTEILPFFNTVNRD